MPMASKGTITNGEDSDPTVSIIVPVKNREATIGELLDSLIRLDYPKDKMEIVIVDGKSTDRTREIVAKYPVKLVTEDGEGLNAARNTGVMRSQGEIIAFTDADCVIPSNWLKRIVEDFKDPDIGCVGGTTEGYYKDYLSKYSDESIIPVLRRFKKYEVRNTVGAKQQYPAGCNMAIRRKAIENAGGFDESIHFGFDEDELVERICKEQNYKLVLDPKLYVKHKHRTRLKELLQQNFRYGRGNAILLKRKKFESAYSFAAAFAVTGFSLWVLACFTMLTLAFITNSALMLQVFLGAVFIPYIGLIGFYITRLPITRNWASVLTYPLIDYLRVSAFCVGAAYQLALPSKTEEA